jgi:ribonuclease HI
LHVDGAARGNPGPAGIGAVISDENGKLLLKISEYIGETTNNIAEYSALIFALQSLRQFEGSELIIYSDSELLVQQLKGAYKVKNQNLKVYFGWAKGLLQAYEKVEIYHVAREQNAGADKLANEAVDKFLAGEKKLATLKSFPEQEQLF